MRVNLKSSHIHGRLRAPASKSYTIRSLIAASLAEGTSHIYGPLEADDTLAVSEVLAHLGISIVAEDGSLSVSGGSFSRPGQELYCHDSAATLRFMTAVCSALPFESTLVAGPGLAGRPVGPLLETLRNMGAYIEHHSNRIVIKGGALKGGTFRIDARQSSQYLSGLLLMAPLVGQEVVYILEEPLPSRPYIDITLHTLNKFGIHIDRNGYSRFAIQPQPYRTADFSVEGDWSSASYFLALGATSNRLTLENLNVASLQADRAILDILKKIGASVVADNDLLIVSPGQLKAIDIDLCQCIDLLPTLAVCLALADGESRLEGIAGARLKESNRIAALVDGLRRTGIEVKEDVNCLTITGGKPRGAVIDSFNDHRIAMAFGILGLKTGNMVIQRAECVSKTYPRFWDELRQLGGKVGLEYG